MRVNLIKELILLLQLHITTSVLQQNCGTALATRRIVGGYDLGYYKYPWFASLQLKGVAWCAGTLIGPGIVVSAAHCFKHIKKGIKLEDVYTVKLGVYNNCDTNETYQKIYHVKKVHVHDEYYKQKPYFDISILILDGDTSAYQPACVTGQEMTGATRAAEALIQGLGDIKFNSGQYPCEVREARVLIYDDDQCAKMLGHQGETDRPRHAFCAGYLEGGIDACQGDSGGPLVTLNNQHKYYLLGITSFGFDCAAKDTLGIYTDVSHFLEWIEKKTNIKLTSTNNNNTTADPINTTNPGSSPGAIIPTSFVTKPPPIVQVVTPAGNDSHGPIKITIEIKKKKHGKNENKKKHSHKKVDLNL